MLFSKIKLFYMHNISKLYKNSSWLPVIKFAVMVILTVSLLPCTVLVTHETQLPSGLGQAFA